MSGPVSDFYPNLTSPEWKKIAFILTKCFTSVNSMFSIEDKMSLTLDTFSNKGYKFRKLYYNGCQFKIESCRLRRNGGLVFILSGPAKDETVEADLYKMIEAIGESDLEEIIKSASGNTFGELVSVVTKTKMLKQRIQTR